MGRAVGRRLRANGAPPPPPPPLVAAAPRLLLGVGCRVSNRGDLPAVSIRFSPSPSPGHGPWSPSASGPRPSYSQPTDHLTSHPRLRTSPLYGCGGLSLVTAGRRPARGGGIDFLVRHVRARGGCSARQVSVYVLCRRLGGAPHCCDEPAAAALLLLLPRRFFVVALSCGYVICAHAHETRRDAWRL